MSKDYIQRNLEEETKTIADRLNTLNGRLTEWKMLGENTRVGKVYVEYRNELMVYSGFLLNQEFLFITDYSWRKGEDRIVLRKRDVVDRGMALITASKSKKIFECFCTDLDVAR